MPEPVAISEPDPTWPARFEQEKARIVRALGPLTEGGIAENVQHIGSTSVPGLPAKPCVDILLAAWPSPLPPEGVAALEALGYAYRGEHGIPGREYLTKGPHDVHLHVVTGDSDFWTDHLLFRDYLRATPRAARAYAERKRDLAERFRDDRGRYQAHKAPLVERLMDEARRWYREEVGFEPLREVVRELGGFAPPWFVSSGWALDLHLGRVTRVHHDVDIAIFREDQLELQRHMQERGWRFVAPDEGRLEPWPPGTRLELPRHQAHAHREGRFIDFLLSEREGPVWRFRRDPSVVRTVERLILRSEDGVPYLAPEVVLLFKSAHAGGPPRARDQLDFESAVGALGPEGRAWLRWALAAYRPDHPWADRLAAWA